MRRGAALMRRVRNLAVAVLVAALSICRVAFADAIAPGDEQHWLLFSGVDLWRNGAFAHGGVLWSPDGLDREGFTLKVLLAGGTYYYGSGPATVKGRLQLAAVMPGWRIKQDRLEIVVAGGPESRSTASTISAIRCAAPTTACASAATFGWNRLTT